MKNASIRLAIVAAAVFAAFCAFMQLYLEDGSMAGSVRVTASASSVSTGGTGLAKLVEGAANDADAVILREVNDLHSRATRHLYLASGPTGGAEAQWLEQGYPGFRPNTTWVMHPAAELDGVDPRGVYYVFGSAGAEDELVSTFEELGFQVEASPTRIAVGEVVSTWLVGPFSSATLVFLLLVALLIATGVTSNAKAYAILRLYGATKSIAVARDARRLISVVVLAVVSALAISLFGLWFYNHLHQLGRFLGIAGVTFVVILAAQAVIYRAMLNLVWDTELVDGIKGRLGFRATIPIAYLIRVPGLLVSVTLLAATFAGVGAVAEATQARADLDAAGNVARPFFDGRIPREEEGRMLEESGAWLKEEDAAGRVVLALPESFEDSPEAEPEFLIVNDTYLAHNAVLSSNGARVRSAPQGTVLLLVPDNDREIKQQVESRLRDMGAMAGAPTQSYEMQTIRAEQSHFLYEPTPGAGRPARLSDVPLAVVNSETDLIGAADYAAYASQGRVLVTDPEVAVAKTPPALMGAFISAYVPVAQRAADDLAERWLELQVRLGSLLVALGVLLATAVGLAQIHVRGNSQQILVRYLHGWTFTATHRWLLRTELVVAGLVLVWSVWTYLSVLYPQLTGDGGQPPVRGTAFEAAGWQPWALVLIAAANVGLLVVAVHTRARTMIRTRSEETA